jgi:hypothetical protein
MAREAAIQQRKQDDCNARLNAVGSPSDKMTDAFERLANADRCRANPNITPEQVALLKPGETAPGFIPDSVGPPAIDLSAGMVSKPSASSHLPPGYTLEQLVRKSVRPKTIEAQLQKTPWFTAKVLPLALVARYSVKSKAVRTSEVIRLDSINGNVQIKTPNGITGWVSGDEINY